MVEYLDTQNIGGKISNIIKSAKKELIIISPFLQVSPIYRDYIKGVANYIGKDLRIKIVSREIKDDKEKAWIEEINNIDLRYKDSVHAKCYMNEEEAVITSMNLYGFSEQNNYEMGVLISKGNDRETFEKLYNDVEFLVRNSVAVNGKKEEVVEVEEKDRIETKLTLEQQKTFELLKKWRYEKSWHEKQPAYLILKDREIKDIILQNVSKRDDLRNIKGIADAKINKFGYEIIEAINDSKRYNIVKILDTKIEYNKYEGYDKIKVKYNDTGKEIWTDTKQKLPEKDKLVAVNLNKQKDKTWFNDYFYLED